jgi:sialate O-acetylesterase
MKNLLFFLFSFLFCQHTLAQLQLCRLFADHAVLQRQKPIQIWGNAKPNEAVALTFANQAKTTRADANGTWRVAFAAMEAGGPYTLNVASGKETLMRTDILIGEVWLCSGQSNMEWKVSQANDFRKERQNANFPSIRHYNVAHEVALQPEKELKNGDWSVCSSETVGDFTAVGFFFAREIYQKMGIPIGLLHSSWGGSQVESWISKEGMLSSEELKNYAQNLPTTWEDADKLLERNIKKKLLGDANKIITLEEEKKYLQAEYDFSTWHSGDALGQWDWKGIWAWRGNGYMAKSIDIPSDYCNVMTTLNLAEHFGYDEVYLNGKLIFAGIQKGVRHLPIPANTWKSGTNKLMIKINQAIEPEWFGLGWTGSADDLSITCDKQQLSLADNKWKLMPAFAEPHTFVHSSNNVGTSIYNKMIAPLLPFPIKGVLWYQGETNADRAHQYRKTFPLLIQDWRTKWNDEFPFYFVQLATFGGNQNSNEGSKWAELREAQTLALQLPKTGMAVTTDIGNPTDIHPTNKQDVGKRLAAVALKNTYNQAVIPTGPLFEKVVFEQDKAIVSFQSVGKGLVIKDKYNYLKGFEIAGEDHIFYYAKAEIKENSIVVSASQVPKPVAVRYAWSDAPVDANLFNSEGYPASPFRTDNWKLLTEGVRFE